MSKNVSLNFTDSSGATAKSLVLPLINYGVDFAKKEDAAGEAAITNLTSPTDTPNTMRFATTAVADVYKNTGINPIFRSPSKRGFRMIGQVHAVYTVTDTEDASYRVDLPIEGHLVIKAPNDANITAAMIEAHIARVVRCFYETDATLRIAAMSRGSLLPKDI